MGAGAFNLGREAIRAAIIMMEQYAGDRLKAQSDDTLSFIRPAYLSRAFAPATILQHVGND